MAYNRHLIDPDFAQDPLLSKPNMWSLSVMHGQELTVGSGEHVAERSVWDELEDYPSRYMLPKRSRRLTEAEYSAIPRKYLRRLPKGFAATLALYSRRIPQKVIARKMKISQANVSYRVGASLRFLRYEMTRPRLSEADWKVIKRLLRPKMHEGPLGPRMYKILRRYILTSSPSMTGMACGLMQSSVTTTLTTWLRAFRHPEGHPFISNQLDKLPEPVRLRLKAALEGTRAWGCGMHGPKSSVREKAGL
jgi:hypothetical protein